MRELVQRSPVLVELGERFAAAGHALHLVGGSVRDALLGRLGDDLDLTTDARPEQVLALVEGWAEATWDAGIAFGTVGLQKKGARIEITTYRAEAYDRTSRKPDVAYGDSLEDDLVRRDFAMNAMALALPDWRAPGRLRRPVRRHGRPRPPGRDRTPGTPEDSFDDDPLRMLRAARFASQLGFEVAPEVVAAMTDRASRIEIVSAERVRGELEKLLLGAHPRKGLALLVDTGLADARAPRAAGAAARDRRAPPAQGRVRAHAAGAGAGDRAGDRRAGPGAAARRAAARHRQARDPPASSPAAASPSTTTR